MVHVKLKRPYRSIKKMNEFDLPDFSVLVGRNGVGKTQLLDAISGGSATVSGLSREGIEKYDIASFQPRDSGQAGWANSSFPQRAVARYFSQTSGPTLVEIAEKIFQQILTDFGLEKDIDARRKFEAAVRRQVRQLPDFQVFESNTGDDAAAVYSQAIRNQIIQELFQKNSSRQKRGGIHSNPAILVSLAMKLSNKLAHELSPNDILQAAYYEETPLEIS